MKRFLFLALLICALFTACQKDELNGVTEKDLSEMNARLAPLYGPAVVETTMDDLHLCIPGIFGGINKIQTTSAWTVGNSTSPNYIDFLLDRAFHCSPTFSTCAIRPASRPTLVYADILFRDEGRLIFDPTGEDLIVYDYLSKNISVATAKDITLLFACEIMDYKDTYLPEGSYISSVDFSGDALLCTCPSGTARYLRASVTFWVF